MQVPIYPAVSCFWKIFMWCSQDRQMHRPQALYVTMLHGACTDLCCLATVWLLLLNSGQKPDCIPIPLLVHPCSLNDYRQPSM